MRLKRLPTKNRLRKLFIYHSGKIFRISSGKRVGYNDGHGYRRIRVDGSEYQEHRIIWGWYYGRTSKFIDHRNGKKLDNRIQNLRKATKAENEWHTPKRKNNTTGFKNVYAVKGNPKGSRYWAYITIKGKRKGLGCYATPEAAHRAYKKASKKLHGEFTWFS